LAEHFSPIAVARQVRRTGALRIALALLAVIAVGALLQRGSQLLARAGLVPVDQHYVALALPHPTALPAHADHHRPLVFSFDVANHMGSPIDQHWRASGVTAAGVARLLRTGTVAVPAGVTRLVNVSITLPAGFSPSRIEVSLPGRQLAPVFFHLTAIPTHAAHAPPVHTGTPGIAGRAAHRDVQHRHVQQRDVQQRDVQRP
jgi:hypothetical protein